MDSQRAFTLLFGFSLLGSAVGSAQWVPTNGPYGGSSVSAFLVSGKNVFAGTNQSQVYRSTDEATTWTLVDSALSNAGVMSFTA